MQKVVWLVGELGLPHRRVPRGGSRGGLDDPGFRAQNPNGRIPAVEDDGPVVWESHAVLRYVAARRGAGRFSPADPAVRSRADRWMDRYRRLQERPAYREHVLLPFDHLKGRLSHRGRHGRGVVPPPARGISFPGGRRSGRGMDQHPIRTDQPVTMARNGRLVIPASLREAIGMPEGGPMVASVEDGRVVLEPYAAVVARARAVLRRYIPPGTLLSEELIAERRAEAERE